MAQEASTIARPYAEAAFDRAVESDKLEIWSEMIGMMATAVKDPQLSGLVANPRLDKAKLTELMLEIGGGRLTEEGQNFIRLLADNERLVILPEIASQFEALKAAKEGAVDVLIESAFDMKPAQEKQLSDALKAKLGREVRITSQTVPELIGGVRIRAGDTVIDGSVQAGLSQLAHQLGI